MLYGGCMKSDEVLPLRLSDTIKDEKIYDVHYASIIWFSYEGIFSASARTSLHFEDVISDHVR